MALTNSQAALLAKKIIELRGEIDDAMATYVRDCLPLLVTMDSPDIKLWITSPGGSLLGGLFIFDSLVAYSGQITGTIIGYGQSMAVAVLQACDLRQATPHARILIHDPIITQLSLNTLASRRKLGKALAAQEKYFQRIYKIFSARSGRSLREVHALCKKETELFPEQAKKFGLIDKIVYR